MSKRKEVIKKGNKCNKCGVWSTKVKYVGFDSKFVGFYFLCPECLEEEEDKFYVAGNFSDSFYLLSLPISRV
jgi:hypothetical protein